MSIQISTVTIPYKGRSSGFTLLEVLVAVVVLSVGLLGLAGLQARGLRDNTTAYHRTMATQQAYDIVDRMRSNMQGVTSGAYDNIPFPAPAAGTDCETVECDSAQLAAFDADQWSQANVNLLPSGQGTVVVGAANVFTVTTRWNERRNGMTGAGIGCDPERETDLACIIVVVRL